jgi:TrmH family RNA methyltransferase
MSRARRRGPTSEAALAPSLHALDRVVVVLVHSDGEQNVGSVARLCGNFGATLRLVAPRAVLDVRDALKMAHPCEQLLLDARPLDHLDDALADVDFALATSGKIRDAAVAEPLDVARARLLLPAEGRRIALVFGNERTGLSHQDAARCDRVIRLPTPGPVDSLNLASAVAVALTLFAEAARGDVAPRAPREAREALFACWQRALERAGFYEGKDAAGFAPRLRELVDTMDLNARDVALLEGVLERLGERAGAAASSRPPGDGGAG